MSVDSERMLKLENEVKELKHYINKCVGVLKSSTDKDINALKKTAGEIKVYNEYKFADILKNIKEPVKIIKPDDQKNDNVLDVDKKIKSIVTEKYITDLYRNK